MNVFEAARDVVVINNTSLTHTGDRVWPASHHLIDFLQTQTVLEKCRKIVELGSGCGFVVNALAKCLPLSVSIWATEQDSEDALSHLAKNIDANKTFDRVHVAACEWSHFSSTDEKPTSLFQNVDLLLGADLIYNAVGVEFLPRVFRAALLQTQGHCSVFYAHTLHRYDILDNDFFDAIVALGMDYAEVGEHDDTSEGPQLSSFDAQRVAIFRIWLPNKDVDAQHPRRFVFVAHDDSD